MSTDRSDVEHESEEPDDVQYVSLALEGAAVVIYDLGDPRAWVQSDLTVKLDGMR